MKIGIIGSGIVGKVLAKAFTSEGYNVTLGTRNTSKEDVLAFHTETGITIADFATTAANAELIILATKGTVVLEAIKLAGIENFTDKVVIDTTNPISETAPTDGVLHYFTKQGESLMEQIQTLIPSAKLVKAFNSVGNALMYKPALAATPTMFICGNDTTAKKLVSDILHSFGWEAEDMGKAASAGAIEALCILWCARGFTQNQWYHAFKLLKA